MSKGTSRNVAADHHGKRRESQLRTKGLWAFRHLGKSAVVIEARLKRGAANPMKAKIGGGEHDAGFIFLNRGERERRSGVRTTAELFHG
jgi:hypothetical protein